VTLLNLYKAVTYNITTGAAYLLIPLNYTLLPALDLSSQEKMLKDNLGKQKQILENEIREVTQFRNNGA
jgi:hypothetical protein